MPAEAGAMERGMVRRAIALVRAAMRGEVTWLRYLLASVVALLTDTEIPRDIS